MIDDIQRPSGRFFACAGICQNNEQYNLFMRHIYEWSEAEGGVQKTQKDDCIDSVASMLINVLNANRKVGVVKVGKLEW